MAITVYNSFIVPVVGIVWKAEGDARVICCQMLLTCLLLPYDIAGAMFGFTGGAGAERVLGVVGNLENATVESTASSALAQKYEGAEKEEEAEGVDEAEGVEEVEDVKEAGRVVEEAAEEPAEELAADSGKDTEAQSVVAGGSAQLVLLGAATGLIKVTVAAPESEGTAGEAAAAKAATPDTQAGRLAAPSKGKLRRLKHEQFLARVRGRAGVQS